MLKFMELNKCMERGKNRWEYRKINGWMDA